MTKEITLEAEADYRYFDNETGEIVLRVKIGDNSDRDVRIPLEKALGWESEREERDELTRPI